MCHLLRISLGREDSGPSVRQYFVRKDFSLEMHFRLATVHCCNPPRLNFLPCHLGILSLLRTQDVHQESGLPVIQNAEFKLEQNDCFVPFQALQHPLVLRVSHSRNVALHLLEQANRHEARQMDLESSSKIWPVQKKKGG